MRPWILILIFGIVLIVGGIVALANPFAASLAVTTIVGVLFLFAGVSQLWLAFSDKADRHRLWNGVIGVLALFAGVSLLANPLGGLISLTLLLGILFLVTGVVRLVMAFRLRETPVFWLMLLTGAASVLIGVLIFGNFAAAATTLLGVFLGLQLLVDGIALIALGIAARRSN